MKGIVIQYGATGLLSNGQNDYQGATYVQMGDITYRCGWRAGQHPGTEHQQRSHRRS
ncbi:hypothetical protein ACLB1Q_05440 [Escherichia coli]